MDIPVATPRTVRILNPPAGHTDRVGLKRALRLVKGGRAQWVREMIVIRILTTHHAFKTASQIESERFYDAIPRGMSLREMKRIPIIQPEKMMAR